MPQYCSYCGARVVDNRVQCPRCGHSPAASHHREEQHQEQHHQEQQEQQLEQDRRFPFWTTLPWTLLAAVLLFFLPHLLRSSETRPSPAAAARPVASSARPSASASPAPSAASAPAVVPIAPSAVPLTVTLSSASGGRRVPVGKPVMISAFASLPPGQSATLAISYGKDNGPKTLLALSQGTLTSAAWVPTVPGRYQFRASALNGRRSGAFSHNLTILVTGSPLMSIPPAPAPVQPAPVNLAAVQPLAASPTAAKRVIPKPQIKAAAAPELQIKAAAPRPQVQAIPHPQPYHVAAASFRVERIADTLAGALRQRGFHAFVRPSPSGQYRVETGDFVRRADALKQMQLLQRDGYPALMFQTR